jgi:hypothetical protein
MGYLEVVYVIGACYNFNPAGFGIALEDHLFDIIMTPLQRLCENATYILFPERVEFIFD